MNKMTVKQGPNGSWLILDGTRVVYAYGPGWWHQAFNVAWELAILRNLGVEEII